MFQHPADKIGIDICAQSPAGVQISEHHRKVGQVREHAALVIEPLVEFDRFAIDRNRDLARHRQFQPGCRHHDIGGQELPIGQPHTALFETGDMAGDDAGLARIHRIEQILIRHQTKPLFPRIIRRGEAGLVVIRAERFLDLRVERVLHLLRIVARQFEAVILHLDVLEPGDPVGEGFGQEFAQRVGDPVLCRAREHPGRRALQHGHVTRFFRH